MKGSTPPFERRHYAVDRSPALEPANPWRAGETFDHGRSASAIEGITMLPDIPSPTATPIPPDRPAAASQAGAAAATQAAAPAPVVHGALRMPPVNRLQRTEFLGVPVWHAPFGPSHADWPIVATYARLVWREEDAAASQSSVR